MILETLQKRETVMNIHEVANLLGLSESLVYRMAASYQIPCVRFCGALRFDPSELAAWYEERLDAHPADLVLQLSIGFNDSGEEVPAAFHFDLFDDVDAVGWTVTG
jgi:excisionase family DNA binding protein